MKKLHSIQHSVSEEFRRAAERFKLAPERLAELLCEDFACRTPNELLIVSCSPTSVLINQDAIEVSEENPNTQCETSSK